MKPSSESNSDQGARSDQAVDASLLNTTTNMHTSDASLELLAAHVEAFLEGWASSDVAPDMAQYLPDHQTGLRRKVLIELIKVDLEYRYNSDGPAWMLEDYVAEFPELMVPDGMPLDLIHEEYHVRESVGELPDLAQFRERFPEHAAALERLFGGDGRSGSESLTGSQVNEALRVGDHVGDFYLMSDLGTGAFGSVYLARQESMQRLVALKISADRGTEAQTLAQLDHPNIVRVYDQTHLSDRNLRLLYMQFVAGGTLQPVVHRARSEKRPSGQILAQVIAESVARTGLLSAHSIQLKNGMAEKSWPEVVCCLGMDLAHALQYAHSHGILHRDVKPANILLDINGSAKLADFNISFCSSLEGVNPTSYFGGSLAYMSPEQLEACDPRHATQPTDLDGRSDLFSLGILMWELLYGVRPYADESVSGTWNDTVSGMAKLRYEGPASPQLKAATAVERQLLSVLKRCLQPNVLDRYQSADDLAHELGLCLQPRVAAMLQRSETGWRRRALQYPLAAFLLASIGPHMPASLFNFLFNDVAIQRQLASIHPTFQKIAITVNVIAFSIGFAFCIRYCRPVVNRLRDLYRLKYARSADDAKIGAAHERPASLLSIAPKSADDSSGPKSEHAIPASTIARLRALKLSRFITILGITEWFIAGMVYPIVLDRLTEDLPMWWYGHFLTSLLICGLIAAAYPFFLTSTLALQAFVPALLRSDRLRREDREQLQKLSEQSAWSLYLAGGVPAAGTLILLLIGNTTDPHSANTLIALSILGIVGFGFALSLSRSLQADIEALLEVSRLQEARGAEEGRM